ncbi:MAG: UvrB/UvrC motif-containing protein, partial [Sedimentisphaerales bacterium]|nr:UvrB/UvrC motif-containing protein [Sedimentisphaerales bacterium]
RAAYPDSYEEFFPRLEVWFVYINPEVDYPFFATTKQFKADSGKYWGPFADGKSATRCVEILQDVFELCRRSEILINAPNATACSYAQMNRCSAVCNGTVSKTQYHKIIDRAIDFLNSSPQTTLDTMREQMQKLSDDLRFEQAQRLKEKIERLKTLLLPVYRWVAPLKDFLVLAFQPGPPVKLPGRRARQPRISCFLIGPGWVDQIESFPSANAIESCRALLDHINLAYLQDRKRRYKRPHKGLFAWTAHLLYQNKTQDRGLYLRFDENFTADDLAQKLTTHFTQSTKSTPAKLSFDSFSLSAQSDEGKSESTDGTDSHNKKQGKS